MTHIFSPTSENLQKAATLLKAGGVLAFPTETVYGLAADAANDRAVASIYAIKNRPDFNPLIVHSANLSEAQKLVEFTPMALKLAEAFWPGPFTLVLKRRPDSKLSLLLSAGLDTVAVRVPAHPVAQQLLTISGLPLAAPSANLSGRVSPTQAAHVAEELSDKIEMILDGGACAVGIESTVVDASGEVPVILRPGCVTQEDIKKIAGAVELAGESGGKYNSPGMLQSHYAPILPVRLNATEVNSHEALIAFGSNVPSGAAKTVSLSRKGDLKEAAANLFATLRLLDKPEFSAIAVMPIPEEGLGVAINDRLRRAAARA